jgi:hypothetical protein
VVPAELGAARHLPVNVLVTAAVALYECCKQIVPLGASVRIFHFDCGETAHHPPHVRIEAEGAAAIDGHDFVGAVAIEEPTIERRDARLSQRHELAIQIAER